MLIENALISDNCTENWGWGASIVYQSNALHDFILLQSTIVNNKCYYGSANDPVPIVTGDPGGLVLSGTAYNNPLYTKVINSIIVGNSGASITNYNISVLHSAVTGVPADNGSNIVGSKNLTYAEIDFVYPTLGVFIPMDAYRLKNTSPCVDAGDNQLRQNPNLPAKDLAWNTRVLGNDVDMGAFENQGYPWGILPPPPTAKNQKSMDEILDEDLNTVSDKLSLIVYPSVVEKGQNINLQLRQGDAYYPNPISVDIYSMQGVVVYRNACSNGDAELPVPAMAAGIYIVSVRTQYGTLFAKKIVVR
jgi:hypothetical protein